MPIHCFPRLKADTFQYEQEKKCAILTGSRVGVHLGTMLNTETEGKKELEEKEKESSMFKASFFRDVK